jgi:hypothetical protein
MVNERAGGSKYGPLMSLSDYMNVNPEQYGGSVKADMEQEKMSRLSREYSVLQTLNIQFAIRHGLSVQAVCLWDVHASTNGAGGALQRANGQAISVLEDILDAFMDKALLMPLSNSRKVGTQIARGLWEEVAADDASMSICSQASCPPHCLTTYGYWVPLCDFSFDGKMVAATQIYALFFLSIAFSLFCLFFVKRREQSPSHQSSVPRRWLGGTMRQADAGN